MFNLAPRHGQKSEFAGPYFECMKAPFHGKNGHIAMQTPDLESAVAELREKGFSFREETAAYDETGKLKNIYLTGEYGGFAILCGAAGKRFRFFSLTDFWQVYILNSTKGEFLL